MSTSAVVEITAGPAVVPFKSSPLMAGIGGEHHKNIMIALMSIVAEAGGSVRIREMTAMDLSETDELVAMVDPPTGDIVISLKRKKR